MGIAEQLVTADVLRELPSERHCELVRGEIVDMPPPGMRHGLVCGRVARRLSAHVDHHRLGLLLTNDAGFLLSTNPDTVRGPDISFVRADRVPADLSGYFHGAPDLAVEVLSPNDSAGQIDAKVQDYLAAGCRLVIVLNPERKSATLHSPDHTARTLFADQTLSTGDVLPGFSCPVAELFE
jgi:Uma2 family endonuclease